MRELPAGTRQPNPLPYVPNPRYSEREWHLAWGWLEYMRLKAKGPQCASAKKSVREDRP
jgi:hypothetical protein